MENIETMEVYTANPAMIEFGTSNTVINRKK